MLIAWARFLAGPESKPMLFSVKIVPIVALNPWLKHWAICGPILSLMSEAPMLWKQSYAQPMSSCEDGNDGLTTRLQDRGKQNVA